MGIYLHADKRAGKLRAVATDGHRLSRFDMPLPEDTETMRGVIIPGKTIRLWPQLLGKDQSEPVTIEVAESFIRVRSDPMTLYSKVVRGTYPDYERVVPRVNNQVAFVNLTDVANAVDRLLVFREGKAPKSQPTFSNGSLNRTIRSETGEAEEGLAADCDFDLEIGFNPKYLREMRAAIAGLRVRLAMADPGSPPLITDEGDMRRELVLMPMRV